MKKISDLGDFPSTSWVIFQHDSASSDLLPWCEFGFFPSPAEIASFLNGYNTHFGVCPEKNNSTSGFAESIS